MAAKICYEDDKGYHSVYIYVYIYIYKKIKQFSGLFVKKYIYSIFTRLKNVTHVRVLCSFSSLLFH